MSKPAAKLEAPDRKALFAAEPKALLALGRTLGMKLNDKASKQALVKAVFDEQQKRFLEQAAAVSAGTGASGDAETIVGEKLEALQAAGAGLTAEELEKLKTEILADLKPWVEGQLAEYAKHINRRLNGLEDKLKNPLVAVKDNTLHGKIDNLKI